MWSQAKRRTTIYRCISGVVMEQLEGRLLLSTTTTATADEPDPVVPVKLPEATLPLQGIVGTPLSLSPAMINAAYGFDDIAFDYQNNDYLGTGAGTTIAIVDAFGSPTVVNDLETFDSHWGISNNDAEGNFALTIQPLGGAGVTPGGTVAENADWAAETDLDVEWAHAVAPGAHILLVESPDASLIHLFDSVVYAADQPGVDVVSMSWGTDVEGNFPNDSPAIYDGFFTTPLGHTDSDGLSGSVAFLAASGDDGQLSYPAASFNVLSVGGLSVSYTLDGAIQNLGAWNNAFGSSGGGSDTIYAQPTNTPYVALGADPETGVWLYDSTPDDGVSGWQVVGGTSFSCAAWAGYVAIIDQGLNLSGIGSYDSNDLIDNIVTDGESLQGPEYFFGFYNGAPPTFPLGTAPYPDFKAVPANSNSGFGLPNSPILTNILLQNLGSAASAFPAGDAGALNFTQTPGNSTAGQTLAPSITVDETNGTLTGSVSISVSLFSPSGGTSLIGTTTGTAVDGVVTFSGLSIDQAGTYELQVTQNGVIAATSSTFTVSAAAPVELGYTTQPAATWQFGPVTPSVVLGMEDQFGNVVTSGTNPVTITIESGPAGGVVSGGTTVTASGGKATFNDLVFNKAGQYTLLATSAGLTQTVSETFDVVGIPATERFLFNGAALGPVLIVQQEHRNASLIAAQGPPTDAEVAAIPAATPAVPAVISGAAASDDGSDSAAADSVGPAFSFVPVAGSSEDDNLINQLLEAN
jgi:subtilase family serine protease